MTCPHCSAENPSGGNFCSSCGSVLEKACIECGALARPDDRFCRACGQSFASATDALTSQQTNPTKQYTRLDIDELLVLRKMLRKEEIASKTLNQDDVDKLFG